LRAPGGLQNLQLADGDRPEPGPGQLQVRIRGSSLNFHDDMVVQGKIPCADGRIPMTDGAGEVVAVGESVEEFKVGDNVISTFWPYWSAGEMTPTTRRDIPGDTIDGYAREYVSMPAHAFTKAPAGYTHLEAATLPCAPARRPVVPIVPNGHAAPRGSPRIAARVPPQPPAWSSPSALRSRRTSTAIAALQIPIAQHPD
jgi:NADPH:quinone reductase-like Zn-dependent oxidoreductase